MSNGTTTRVKVAPKCDLCDMPAKYDAKTKDGPWAYMCEEHYQSHRAFDVLGTGKGQRLVIYSPNERFSHKAKEAQ